MVLSSPPRCRRPRCNGQIVLYEARRPFPQLGTELIPTCTLCSDQQTEPTRRPVAADVVSLAADRQKFRVDRHPGCTRRASATGPA